MRLRIVIAATAVLVIGGGIAAGIVLGGGAAAVEPGLPVVAAENVYGDIAAQIGGPHVAVTSILSEPSADPHLFAPDTRNGLAVARARLVIQNGLGYDAFMEKLEAAAPSPLRRVVTIADALGVRGAGANPHLWYDVPRLGRIAAAIAAALERADPPHAAAYRAGLSRFEASLAPLLVEVARIRARFAGVPVAYTESVPAYLVAAAGLVDRAPEAFTRAIEEGREPTPQAVAAMDGLVRGGRIRALLYNSQAVSPVTRRLRDAARRAGIGVVPVTETLPLGLTVQQWQLAQARALEAALAP